MRKSRADIQRAYRQRLKAKDNEAYLKKERERRRRDYVPTALLSECDKKHRNELNREKLRRFYQRKREARQTVTIQAAISGNEIRNKEIEEQIIKVETAE